ncbi:MAG TPA: hypothetical protein VF989_18375 [Polyangiaceae bacterium]|jgi:hypothetical protein
MALKLRWMVVALGALLLSSKSSLAEPMDPALGRLVVDSDPSCRTPEGRFADGSQGVGGDLDALEEATGSRWCLPDSAAFAKLVNQYGFAFAPSAMHSARTTGLGGFHLSMEAVYTKISSDAAYWREGTQGTVDPATNTASSENAAPSSILQLYSAKIRKGFGFGLELTGSVGFMPRTSIIAGGADVRLSLLEGFRRGLPGILPDIAVGAGVRTISGTAEMQLTTAALDAQISKPLPLQDSSILTPWVGYQYVWIFGDSGLIDLTPATDAINYCNYTGNNIPGNQDPAETTSDGGPLYDGQPVCNGGSALDFNNNAVFDRVRFERQRLLVGVNYRYEVVMVGAQFITDILKPSDAQNDESDKELLEGEDRQWSLVLELGAAF